MARFNVAPPSSLKTIPNFEGAPSYELSNEMKLYTFVCTSLLNDQYYKKATDVDLAGMVKACSPEFVANLAVYARKEMNLRSISIVLAALLCRHVGGSLAKNTVMRVINRVDEITEILAFASTLQPIREVDQKGMKLKKYANKLPRSLLKGLKGVFESGRFKEYHYAKYDRQGLFSLKDAIFLTHPKYEKGGVLDKIVSSTLEAPYTWEVEFSKLGQQKDLPSGAKLAKWMEMIESKKLGHMALLRNLRNIVQEKPSPSQLLRICAELIEGAPTGKQFPFRYWSAFKAVTGIQLAAKRVSTPPGLDPFLVKALLPALEEALKASIKNYPKFEGRTLIACDVSGSMITPISPKSEVMSYDIGLLLGTLLFANDANTLLGIFGDRFEIIQGLSNIPVLNAMQAYYNMEGVVGYSTHGYKVIEKILNEGIIVDNVLMFTDAQMYGPGPVGIDSMWRIYKHKVSPNAKLYIFDLSGYGSTPISLLEKDVSLISGWNDRVFEAVNRLRDGQSSLDMIRNYTAH